MVELAEVLTQDRDYIAAPEARTYPKLSVKLYGKGVVMDAAVLLTLQILSREEDFTRPVPPTVVGSRCELRLEQR